MKKNLTIGIAGGTGSGKTTLTHCLKEHFGDKISLLYQDNYYKRQDTLTYEQRCNLNYDHPDAFDVSLLIQHLSQLQQGNSIQCPVYDYTIHNRSEQTILIPSAPVIIVEGILLFNNAELCNLMDIKIFVDTDADVRILRRILRDVQQRNRTVEDIIQQYLTTVKPMHQQFVEPTKQKADIIIPEGGHNTIALQLLIGQISYYLTTIK